MTGRKRMNIVAASKCFIPQAAESNSLNTRSLHMTLHYQILPWLEESWFTFSFSCCFHKHKIKPWNLVCYWYSCKTTRWKRNSKLIVVLSLTHTQAYSRCVHYSSSRLTYQPELRGLYINSILITKLHRVDCDPDRNTSHEPRALPDCHRAAIKYKTGLFSKCSYHGCI
jgi:hypothetical protein